jgi:S-adenosylmethionine:diacylglycerol 3-amino-3-carboxypropyl transferase
VTLSDREDSIRWVLSPSSQFSTSSLYRQCSFSGVVDVRMEELWCSKLPSKIRNFLWLVFKERIQTVNNLKKKETEGREEMLVLFREGIYRSFVI